MLTECILKRLRKWFAQVYNGSAIGIKLSPFGGTSPFPNHYIMFLHQSETWSPESPVARASNPLNSPKHYMRMMSSQNQLVFLTLWTTTEKATSSPQHGGTLGGTRHRWSWWESERVRERERRGRGKRKGNERENEKERNLKHSWGMKWPGQIALWGMPFKVFLCTVWSIKAVIKKISMPSHQRTLL